MSDVLSKLGSSWADLAVVVFSGALIYLWVIVATRIVGLRSFAKMSSFDFATTVEPLLLMDGDHVIDEHLVRARLTRDDLRAKLREAGVLRLDEVRAVVFETTGDVTVLRGDGPYDDALLVGVRR